jgi:hypothetical protein
MRVLRCYSLLARHSDRNIAGPELLMTTISVFAEAEPQNYKSFASKPIMITSFDSFASVTDNFAWGVTSYMALLTIPGAGECNTEGQMKHWSVLSSEGDALEEMVLTH